MGIIGSSVGAGLGIGASIFGGISASKAMRRVKKNLEERKRENQDWYDRRYNEDATQRADAQRILAATDAQIRARNRGAAGTAAVTGGTAESVAAEKAQNAQAMADAAAQIATAGDRRKDTIESTYQTNKANIDDKLNELEQARAGAIANAVSGVADAGAKFADRF